MTNAAKPPTEPPNRLTVAQAAAQFGPFEGRVWFNTAHQGPLPQEAVTETHRAAALKAVPHRIADAEFAAIPERLRALLARLVHGEAEQIVLGNSTSYGLHLIANGLDWDHGDEVLTVEGDYPATVLPWQRLTPDGVTVRALRPPDAGPLSAAQLAAAIGPRTRLVALTWVDSFTGAALDLPALGQLCRQRGVLLVVNASQALGARPLDVTATPVDAVVACGYKWLCGPYGTGFSWLHPQLLVRLRPQQAYWFAMQAGRGLEYMRETRLRDDLGVRAFDVFCPAAFSTTLPWIAALELILATDSRVIHEHNQQLVEQFLDRLDPQRFTLLSPRRGPARSTLAVLSHPGQDTARLHRRLTAAGIDTAHRQGNLRFSFHLFNTIDDVNRAIQVLHR